MESIASGDDAAMRALYDRHGALLYTLALRLLSDRGDAEEVLQEVMWEAWQRADRFNPLRGSPRTYLVTMLRSRAIDRLRSRPARGDTPVEREKLDAMSGSTEATAREKSPDQLASVREECARVRTALANLGPERRKAIELAYYDGLSQSEIATRLKSPLGTVKSWMRQALLQLRSDLTVPGND